MNLIWKTLALVLVISPIASPNEFIANYAIPAILGFTLVLSIPFAIGFHLTSIIRPASKVAAFQCYRIACGSAMYIFISASGLLIANLFKRGTTQDYLMHILLITLYSSIAYGLHKACMYLHRRVTEKANQSPE